MRCHLFFKLQLRMYMYVHLKKGQDKNRYLKQRLSRGEEDTPAEGGMK